MERPLSKKEVKQFWSHLFGEEDHAELSNLSDEEFDNLVKLLSRIKTPIDWEADKVTKKILLWKPKDPTIMVREYGAIIFLLACMKGAGRKWLKSVS